jgi:hypothetical protein
MKLIDILKEVEDGKEGMKRAFIPQNLVLIPIDIPLQKLEDALNNDSNYKEYSRNIQNIGSAALQSKIEQEKEKIFGPSGKGIKDRAPSKKVAKAKVIWNNSDTEWKKSKSEEIKSRFPKFDITGWEELEFDELPKEAKKHNIFWDFITGPKLDAIIQKAKSQFSTSEKPLNWEIKDEMLVFSHDDNLTVNQAKNIIEKVMKSAGIDKETYKLNVKDDIVKSPNIEPPSSSKPTFKMTLDPKKIKGNKAVEKKIEDLKSTYKKNFSFADKVLIIKNIDKAKKIDLIRFFSPYQKVEEVNEDFKKMMQLRAGIIK